MSALRGLYRLCERYPATSGITATLVTFVALWLTGRAA